VDENWAEQHHSIWYEKVKEREAAREGRAPEQATPAE